MKSALLLPPAALLLVAAWCAFDMRWDYSWARITLARQGAEGWTAVVKEGELRDRTRPWTFVRTPVTSLWFINEKEIRPLGAGCVTLPVLHVSYDYTRPAGEERVECFDLSRGASAIPPGSPRDKILQYLRQRAEAH